MNWIFTFGSGHVHEGHYVKIQGTYDEALQEMIHRYGVKWSFQYNKEEWDSIIKICKKKGIPVETEFNEDTD